MDANHADAWELKINDDVNRQRHHEDKGHSMKPTANPAQAQSDAGQQRSRPQKQPQHSVDNCGRVHLRPSRPTGGNIKHLVQRWKQQHRRGLRTRVTAGLDRSRPDLRLQYACPLKVRGGPGKVGNLPKS